MTTLDQDYPDEYADLVARRPGDPVGGDFLAAAAVAVLTEHLPAWSVPAGLGRIRHWDAVPDVRALQSADLPAGCVVVPGLSDLPARRTDTYATVWRLVAGLYVRGASYSDTQARVGRWATYARTVLLAHPTLATDGGLVTGVTWLGEDLSIVGGAGAARTLGGATVMFDVTVPRAAPFGARPPTDGTDPETGNPVVTHTQVDVTVHRITDQFPPFPTPQEAP